MPVHVGGMVRFSVRVEGEPQPEVTWYRNKTPLRPSANVAIERDDYSSTLFIRRLGAADSGEYRLVARNRGGQADVAFDINVAGRYTHVSLAVLTYIESFHSC